MKKENPELPNKHSQITTLNAFGNYFKHNDEWKGNWIDSINPNATQEIIKSSVRNRSSEFCKEGLNYLVKGQSLDQVIKLWEIVDKWANSIKGKCIEDLRQCGCK